MISNFPLLVAVRTIQEIRRPKQFDDDAEGGSGEDGSDEAADQVIIFYPFYNNKLVRL